MPLQRLKRLFLADDHDVVRNGLRQIIAQEFGDKVEFVEATNASELLDKISKYEGDIVLTDIRMPGRSGIDLLPEIQALKPQLPVIILTAFPEDQYGVQAMRAGAAGFINKAFVNVELPLAIRRIMGGGRYVSPMLAETLALYLGNQAKDQGPPHDALSEREMTVLRLIAQGKETGEIAQELSLSEKTIATYRARIYAKLNLRNPVELARYALLQKLVD